MKIYNLVKTIVFIILGILIFVFKNAICSEENIYNINFLVGALISFYGLEGLIMFVFDKKKSNVLRFLNSSTYLILGVVLFLLSNEPETKLAITCVCWSVWSIMREGEEIFEKVYEEKKYPLIAIINLLESIAVIVLSVLLMLNPGEHHVPPHVVLLGIELILEVTWKPLEHLAAKKETKNESK